MSSKPFHQTIHTVQVQGFKLEFRVRRAVKRTLGSIACISPAGETIEVDTSFDTLEKVIEGVAHLREKMRETVTENLSPHKR